MESPLDLEPEMERLIRRLVPDPSRLVGATEDEIRRVEAHAERALPSFYWWFLARMGRSMGPLAYPRMDCRASTILSNYEDGYFVPDGRRLLIGYSTDEMRPLHLFYDFEFPARDDARVVKMEDPDADDFPQFETFREMVAWGKFANLRVLPSPQRCRGVFIDDENDVLARLHPVMETLGMQRPEGIRTGSHCAFYERQDAAMVTRATVGKPPRIHAFTLGGSDARVLRRILGEVAIQSTLRVEVSEWTPALT
jgi:hypothetical protein